MADPAVPEWVPDFPPVRSARIISVKAQDAARVWEQPVTPGELLTIGKDLGSALGNTGAALARLAVYHAAYQAPADQWFRRYDDPDEPNIYIECAARALDFAGRDMAFALSDHITRSGQPSSPALSAGARLAEATRAAYVMIERPSGSAAGRDVAVSAFMAAASALDAAVENLAAHASAPMSAILARQRVRLEQAHIALRESLAASAAGKDVSGGLAAAQSMRETPADPVAPVAARARCSRQRRRDARHRGLPPAGHHASQHGHPPARRAGYPSPPPRADAAARHVRGTAVTGPGNADRAAWAAQAIEAFQSAAGHHGGLDTAEAIGSLITALCHYADRRGISFGTILTASSNTYMSQRASEQHAYKVGDEVRIRDGAVLAPSLASLPRLGIVTALYPSAERTQQYAIRFPGEVNAMPFISSEIEPAPPFQPVRTRQGTVASLAEAEEVLISTAARVQISHLHKTRPVRADVKDRELLASVLGQACGLTPEEMLRQAGIQVTATVQRELAMQAAADLGREHARTGTRPFETELETAARLADVLREKGCALPGDDPSPRELLWEYRFAFGYGKAGLPRPGQSRSQRDAASPAELAGRNFPAPAGRLLSVPAESRPLSPPRTGRAP